MNFLDLSILISPEDLFLFHQGTLNYAYKVFGAHSYKYENIQGYRFALWAPNARRVSVVGDFNNWDGRKNPMQRHSQDEQIWITFVTDISLGDNYKYELETEWGHLYLKSDPFAFFSEKRPNTASYLWNTENYTWRDYDWQKRKKTADIYSEPINIYEMHLGSWKTSMERTSYRELAKILPDYLAEMGYTHVEFMPLMEHPFDGSWGYQITGYYSPTSRFGKPEDLKYLIDCLHKRNIGVIIDWVPGHFCKDSHGLAFFDGSFLYEKEEHAHWGTLKFDFGKREVWSFLVSNALYWLEEFHFDGIRVDGVASMLYLDYDKEHDSWSPNIYGGRGNLEAIAFIKYLNETVFKHFSEILMIAEESTDWPQVTWPTSSGGLGFNFKWNMGWMNDTLSYLEIDPFFRKDHHNKLTFSLFYAFSENFILPISHDEVVHGKKNLIDKAAGYYENKFPSTRAFLFYMYTHPGKKLTFMGTEFAQFMEWRYYEPLEWFLIDKYEKHKQFHHFCKSLNHFYLDHSELWQLDNTWEGFSWTEADNSLQNILIFLRINKKKEYTINVLNFSGKSWPEFRIGVPDNGRYLEIFNTDSVLFGGKGVVNDKEISSENLFWQGQHFSIVIKLPALAGLSFVLQDSDVIRNI